MSDAIVLDGQPMKTLVERVIKNGKFSVKERESIAIENLKVGDYLSSYQFKDSSIYSRVLTTIETDSYSGKIFTITIGGNELKCLPSHKCLARYRDITRDYCVYVMRRGTAFRVGMSKIWHNDNGCGPYKRLVDEDGDEIWILKTFTTRREALLEESKVSIKFRLPQAMFKFKEGRGSWTDEEFQYVWSNVSNEDDAIKAINHYNRDIRYPYFDRSKKHTSIKRPHEVRACNILYNSEMFTRDKEWVNITASVEDYDGTIYRIQTEKDNNYFSNGILTKGFN